MKAAPVTSIPHIERDERQQRLVDDAALMAGDVSETSPLIGYTVLTFYGDGTSRSAGCRPKAEDHRVGSCLYEAWARAALEKHFTYGEGVSAAYDVLNGDA